MITISKEIL